MAIKELTSIRFPDLGDEYKVKVTQQVLNESLQALTKVTDNEEPCLYPFGGDNGSPLFFVARENKKWFNVYKKDNPFSAAIIQKTSGKNLNFNPVFCPAIDKIAFRCQLEGSNTSDIYMMTDSKGKALNQVTESNNAFEDYPSFNSNGSFHYNFLLCI